MAESAHNQQSDDEPRSLVAPDFSREQQTGINSSTDNQLDDSGIDLNQTNVSGDHSEGTPTLDGTSPAQTLDTQNVQDLINHYSQLKKISCMSSDAEDTIKRYLQGGASNTDIVNALQMGIKMFEETVVLKRNSEDLLARFQSCSPALVVEDTGSFKTTGTEMQTQLVTSLAPSQSHQLQGVHVPAVICTLNATAPAPANHEETVPVYDVNPIPSQLYKEFLYNHGEISPHAVQNCLYNGSPSAAATQAVCPQQHSIITTEACQQNSSSSTEGPLQNSTEGPQQNSTEVSLQNSSVCTEGSLQNSSASTKGPLQNSTEGPQQNITALSTEVSLHNSSVSTEGSVQNSSASTEGPQQNSSASTQGSLQNSSTGPQHNSRASTASTNAAPLQDAMVERARNTTIGETGVTQPSLESRAESGFESMGQPSDHTRISPAGATGQSGNTIGSYSDEDEAMELIPPHPPHAVQNSPCNDSPSAAATQADNGHPPHQSSFNRFLDHMCHHPLQNSAAVSPLRTLPFWDIRKTRYCKSTEFMVAHKLYSFSRSVGGIIKNNHLWGTCSRHGQRHVMTSSHVASPRFADLSDPSNSFVEFNYYDKWPPQQPIRLKIQSIEYSCPKSSLDFCVLLLDIPDSSFEEFQRLSPGLGPQVMLPGAEVEVERVTLIGHPLGRRKSFDYNCPVLDWYQSDEYAGGISSSDDSAIFHADRINYRSTFRGGGSGSSVVAIFDDRPQFVAMHTQGYPTGKTCEVEQGVRMSAIQAHLKEHRPRLYRELFP